MTNTAPPPNDPLPATHPSLRRFVASSLLILLILPGCAAKQPATTQKSYFGPTKSLPEVVAGINQNNARIPTLWSRFDFEAEIKESRAKNSETVVGHGNLQYRAPGEFRLIANKDPVGPILDLGINRERYWMIAPKPGPDTMWWGYVKPGASQINSDIPISPQGMLDVLGIATLSTDLLAEPAPVLRFNNDHPGYYMLVWVRQSGDRLVCTREVWYDMDLRPVSVLIFDRNGRIIIRAYLSEHQRIGEDGPRIATLYRLFFPENGSHMTLALKDSKLSRGSAPNDNSFRFVKTIPVSKEIQVDAQK